MRTAAAAWETPAERPLVVLSLLSSDDRSIAGVLTAAFVTAAGTAAAGRCCSSRCCLLLLLLLLLLRESQQQDKQGGGPPVGTDAIGSGRWWTRFVRVVGMCTSLPEAAGPRNPDGKNNRKANNNEKKTFQRICVHHLVRVKPTRPPTDMAGRPVLSPCLMGLAANVMGRAGPGYST